MLNKSKTVFVAMSGGVDSSVAAALMKKADFNVVGVFMKPPSFAESYGGHSGICSWKQDREDALRVAAKLDIPLLTWDFSKEYEKRVVNYMVRGYKNGITPNPDVMCNKFIKFGLFLDKALEMGADYIATGHYVRLSTNSEFITNKRISESEKIRKFVNSKQIRYSLMKARDHNKDQSYFLYTLTQKQLKRCLFPIGDYKKDEVRKMAKKFGLSNWNKKDSQGVCFVGPLQVKEFLKSRIRPQKGLVLRKSDGKILGEHDGAWFYTIGQRHGLNLSANQPYYVIDKDIKKNIIFVDEKTGSGKSELQISDFNWVNNPSAGQAGKNVPLDCKVKTRYRQKDIDCVIVKNGSDMTLAKMERNNIPVASGQAAVFYKGGEVLGGGIIT